MSRNRKRSAKDIGSESPASGSAKEQSMHGAAGGPQGEKPAGIGRQPPQAQLIDQGIGWTRPVERYAP